MYYMINQYAGAILNSIDRKTHVEPYDWLVQNMGSVDTPGYQAKYRAYWVMNAARLSPDFYTVYFGALRQCILQTPTLVELIRTLYNASTNSRDQKSLQFSFATKLLHMTNRHLPIYDSQVAAFYFFEAPATGLSVDERI